ncbi:hypothetical protein FRC07_005789 [Ceratobasidium sp. 392]|nr:hypothetical protein FRC07_005789 [Ceratobasidium sp. 392]
MHLLVALITLPLTSVVSMEETRAAQGAAVRSPIGRSFRHRPPIIITPHVFKVFDVRIARAEILGVKSKYRDAERILKGVGLNPLIELPEVYKSKEGWKNRIGNDTLGRDLDNHTFNHLDARNNNLEAFWIDDLLPDVEDHTPPTNASLAYVVGKRRCADEIGNGNGAVCDIPPSSSSEESGHEIQDQPASPGSAPLSVIPDNITAPSIPLTGSGSGSDQRDTAHMRVLNYIVGGLDVLYYGSLEFGSPPQGIMLDIDTGSADLWVPTKCSSCDTKQFDSGRSVSFEDTGKPFKATYGSGWAEGTQAQESVSLGSFSVEGQYIGAVTEVSEDFRGSPASGVLGMAFGSISTVKEATFFENLIATTQVTAPLFGVHLTRGKEYGSEKADWSFSYVWVA